MCADDRAERGREVDGRLRSHAADLLGEPAHVDRSVGVGEADVQTGTSRRLLLEDRHELGERLRAAADAPEWHDLAVFDRQDRLHAEQLTSEPGSLPHPAAADKEVERVDGEEQPALVPEALHEPVDLGEIRAPFEAALDRVGEQDDSHGGRAGVDDADALVTGRVGREPSALDRAREPPGYEDAEDPLVPAELVERRREVGRGRLRRLRRLRRFPEPRVELLRAELDVVLEDVVAETNVERHHPPVLVAPPGVGEIGRRVENDGGVLSGEPHRLVPPPP
jgi:hypothetical protein